MSLRSGKTRHTQSDDREATTGYQSETVTPSMDTDDTMPGPTTPRAGVTSLQSAVVRRSTSQGAMGPPAESLLTPGTLSKRRPEKDTEHASGATTTQNEPLATVPPWTGSTCSRETGVTAHSQCRRRYAEAAQRKFAEKQRLEQEIAKNRVEQEIAKQRIAISQQQMEQEIASLNIEALRTRITNLHEAEEIEKELIAAEEEEEEHISVAGIVRQAAIPMEKTPIPQWLARAERATAEATTLTRQSNVMDGIARDFERGREQPTEGNLSPPAATALEGMLMRQTLPRDLPLFDGDPERWLVFATQLDQQTRSLTRGEVMTRLQRCLKGKAYQTVSALLCDPDQLPRIREVLEMRFGRPDILIGRLINHVRSLPSLTSDGTSSENMVDFTITVGNLISSLKSLKKPEYAYNLEILRELEGKLSGYHLTAWSEAIIEKYNGNPTLFDFGEFMSKLGRQATAVNRANWGAKPARPKAHDQKPATKKVYATDAVSSEKAFTQKRVGPQKVKAHVPPRVPIKAKCAVCETPGHDIGTCRKFMGMQTGQRRTWVKEAGACFKCLKKGHFAAICKTETVTHPLLTSTEAKPSSPHRKHAPRQNIQATNRKATNSESESDSETATSAQGKSYACTTQQEVLLRVTPVTVKGPKGSVTVLALLDEGSSVTLLESSIAQEIGIQGKKSPLILRSIAGPHTERSQLVSFDIRGSEDKQWHRMNSVRTIEQLNTPTQALKNSDWKEWKHLHGLVIPEYKGKTKLLIGMDNYRLIAPRSIVWGPPGLPTATRSLLGWTISGQVKGPRIDNGSCYLAAIEEESVDQMVTEYLSSEEAGVTARRPQQKRHAHAEATLAATTRFDNGRWETGLLWRSEGLRLPPSRIIALRRLKSLESKLKREPETAAAYCHKIKDYVEKGYARELTEEEEKERGPRTFYLPHFCVTNPNKPGKIRVVFDAAAEVNGRCLNDALETGPDLLNPLLGILLKFREKEIAFTTDIKEMFLRIKIRGKDQDSQRFLWKDLRTEGERCNLTKESCWFRGPAFLRGQDKDWPQETWAAESPDIRTVCAIRGIKPLIKFKRFSSWRRLQRCMAYVLRFIERCRRQASPRGGVILTQKELGITHNVLLTKAQEEMFPQDIGVLREGGKRRQTKSTIQPLAPPEWPRAHRAGRADRCSQRAGTNDQGARSTLQQTPHVAVAHRAASQGGSAPRKVSRRHARKHYGRHCQTGRFTPGQRKDMPAADSKSGSPP